MWMIWLGTILVVVRFFEIGWFASLSWWWVAVPFALAFVYFEVLEPMFSLDKKKTRDESELYKKKRLAKQLERGRKRP